MNSKYDYRTIKKVSKKTRKNHLQRIMIYELLRDYVANGRALVESFLVLEKRKREDKDPSHKLFGSLNWLVYQKNHSVLDAMRIIFPEDEVLLIEAYPGHKMVDGFNRAAVLAESKKDISGAFWGAMSLPLVSLFIGFGALYVLLSNQVPLFLSILPEDQWDDSSRGILTLHTLFVENLAVTVGALVALVVWISAYSIHQPYVGHRKYVDSLPPWSIQRGLQAASFMDALGAMMSQRISLIEALERIKVVAPKYLKSHLVVMQRRLENNEKPGQALSVPLFDRETSGYIKDFIDQNSLPAILIKLADKNRDLIKKRITGVSVTIGVVIILGVNAVNGYVAFTGFQLNQQVREFIQ